MDISSEKEALTEVINQVSETLKQKRFEDAVVLCQTQLKQYPEQPDLKARLAFAFHKLKKYMAAEQLYRELVETHKQAISLCAFRPKKR